MKFLLRFLLVLAVAMGAGLVLYYAVQALPGASVSGNQSSSEAAPNGPSATGNPSAGTDRPGNNRPERIRWRSIARIARHTFMFAIVVFATVLAKGFVFGKESKARKPMRADISKNKNLKH